jgi:hypothetical protein
MYQQALSLFCSRFVTSDASRGRKTCKFSEEAEEDLAGYTDITYSDYILS